MENEKAEDVVENSNHNQTGFTPVEDEKEPEANGMDGGQEAEVDAENNNVNEDIEADTGVDVRKQLESRISTLEAELSETRNRFLRTQADLENFRRRTRREKEEAAKYAALPVMRVLLPVLDNLERALAAGRDADTADGLVQGVEMVNRQILDVLAGEGLQPIEAVGQPFDPEYHEAVMQVESDDYDAGTVAEELQKGYMLGDRVIRPSMVKVTV